MFLGEFNIKFSGQGRIILPKKLREELSGSKIIVLSRGFEGCIWGFKREEFEIEAKKQLEISATEERARLLRRYLFSASSLVELDFQGRFVIPENLLEFARLKEEIVVVGAGDHFEIWDKLGWQDQIKAIEEGYGRLS